MILVIGATGTVGTEVVKQLVTAGQRPRVFVHDLAPARDRFGEEVEYAVGSLDQPPTIAASLDGIDRVFCLTTQSHQQPEWERSVITAAANKRVEHLVKLSVFRADEQSPLQIARQHHLIEETLRSSPLTATILRPVFFMQNLLNIVRDGVIATAAEDGRLAMIDARDVAAVAVVALTRPGHGGKTYTLTGPEALSFDDVASILSQELGSHIRHVRVAPAAVRAALHSAGRPDWFANDMANLHRMLTDGYEDVVTDDVRTVTGRSPNSLSTSPRTTRVGW